MDSEVIAGSRGKAAMLLAGSAAFVAIAAMLPPDGRDATWRWWGGGFFGLCALVFAVLLVRPQRLVMDDTGFAIEGGLARTPRRVSWRDVEAVFVHRLPRGGRVVGYTLRSRPDTSLGAIARRMGVDGLLPQTLPGSAEALVATLETRRAAALKG